jgi:hypothetical protein
MGWSDPNPQKAPLDHSNRFRADDVSSRRLRARLAAHSRWARHDPKVGTVAARAAFEKRFLDEVDRDRVLTEDERLRRAQSARKAYYTRLTLQSAQSRRRRARR